MKLLKRAAMLLPPIARIVGDLRVHQAAAAGFQDQANAVGVELADARQQLTEAHAQLAARPKITPGTTGFRPLKRSALDDGAGTAEAAAAALLHGQMCLFGDALPFTRCHAVRALAERAMADTDGATLGEVFGTDRTVLQHVLRSPCLAAARLYFRQHCGTDDLLVLPQGLAVRKFAPGPDNPAALPFHQDAFGFPPEFDVVNCWTLLSPDECGETSPGLEFVPDAVDHFLGQETSPTSQHYGFLETPHDAIARYLEAYDPWRPSIRLGDVMMFTKFALHRTALDPRQHLPRFSAEIRLIANTPAVAAYLADHPVGAERVADILA